ncbi:MAG: hypothetical protein Phog2KO_15160 [Phototrophicaceae bacterium]
MSRYLCLLVILLISAMGVYAQSSVTQDEVDEVASRMFCPVCENEPLDVCYNPTCIQWKREIRDLLAEGNTPDEIITSFVDRYGQHVVGVPQDPLLRFLSFGAPILGTIIALIIGLLTFRRWQSNDSEKPKPISETSTSQDNYRSQIERDLM